MRFQLTLNEDSERDNFIKDKLASYTNTKEGNTIIKYVMYRYFKGELVQQEAISSILSDKDTKIKMLEAELEEVKAELEELRGDKKEKDFLSFLR